MEKIELKKIFNKHILKDKSFIKMVCFTIVLLLVLVLGNTFGYVSADGDTSNCVWLTEEEYTASDVYDSHNFFQGYMNLFSDINNSNATISSNVIMNHDWSDTFTGENTADVDVSDFKYYLIIGSAYPSYWRVYFFPDDVYMYVESNALYTYYDIMNSQDFYYCDITPWGDGTNVLTPYCIFPDTLLHGLGQWSGSFQDYYMSVSTGQSTFICSTNMPIYTYQTNRGWTYGSYFNDLMAYLDGDDTANIVNVNYRYDSGECVPLNGCDSLENCDNYGGISDGDDTSYENNLYANSADWTLNNYKGDIAKNYKSVSATFTSNLNDYINDIDNIEDYSIEFDCNAYIEYYYTYVVDNGTISASLGSNFANVQYTTPSLGSSNTFRWSCSYYIPETIQSYQNYDHINCSDFANNGYSKTFGFNTLFAVMLPNGTYTDSNGTHDISIGLSQLMQLMNEKSIGYAADARKTFKLTCTATIVHDASGKESGSYSETFDLFTGESTTDDSSMLTNLNPSNDNSDESASLVPTENNNSVSASTGNVTQTVNVNNEGAKYIPSIISSLIPSSFGDTSTGLAQRFTTLVDSNNFITVMANTVPAIPSTVWTYLTEYLGISLYLLACAFVLRLILDLL